MRPAPRRSRSDIEEAHVLGVLLDELPTRLDLVAHQHGEDAIRYGGVLDLEAHQHPPRRIQRGVPELGGVHLAETLEASDLDALLGQLERERLELVERLGAPGLL